jgi:hypothetical protein
MKRIALFVIGVALLSAQTLSAHHSFAAEFDRNSPVTLTGSVTRVDWGNPHIWVFMDVKDDTGKVSNWGVEGGAPNALFRNGWRKDSLKVGDTVTVEGFKSKDGLPRANANRVTLPDVRLVFAGSSSGDK